MKLWELKQMVDTSIDESHEDLEVYVYDKWGHLRPATTFYTWHVPSVPDWSEDRAALVFEP